MLAKTGRKVHRCGCGGSSKRMSLYTFLCHVLMFEFLCVSAWHTQCSSLWIISEGRKRAWKMHVDYKILWWCVRLVLLALVHSMTGFTGYVCQKHILNIFHLRYIFKVHLWYKRRRKRELHWCVCPAWNLSFRFRTNHVMRRIKGMKLGDLYSVKLFFS